MTKTSEPERNLYLPEFGLEPPDLAERQGARNLDRFPNFHATLA